MNGVPELLVLQLLSERSMYGYELVRAIRAETGEAMTIGEGVIYPVLHALEAKRCLAARTVRANGRDRVYYRVTPKGKRRLVSLRGQWQHVACAVGLVLAGGGRV
jgi:PadR family transcriptional regulator PadR